VWLISPRHCTPISTKIAQHLLELCTKVFCCFYAPRCTCVTQAERVRVGVFDRGEMNSYKDKVKFLRLILSSCCDDADDVSLLAADRRQSLLSYHVRQCCQRLLTLDQRPGSVSAHWGAKSGHRSGQSSPSSAE